MQQTIEVGGRASRIKFGVAQMLIPNFLPMPGVTEAIQPAGRDAFRAYFAFALDSAAAMEQAQPGSTYGGIRFEISLLWAQLNQHAPDMIASLTLAMSSELTDTEILSTVHAHPTFAEAIKEAVADAHGEARAAPALQFFEGERWMISVLLPKRIVLSG